MTDRKRTAELDWADVKTLMALVQHETLSGAARALGVTHATVARRIDALEQTLGHRLFRRQGGGYVLTPEGRKIADLAAPMEESALAITRAAAGLKPELEGSIRITCTEAVGSYLVAPVLALINRQHPRIEIELLISEAKLSLARREADIALRLAAPGPDDDLSSIHLADVQYGFYASRDYLERRDNALDFIGYTADIANWLEAQALNSAAEGHRIVMRTNNLTNRIAAVRQGIGIGLIPCRMAESWPELVRVVETAPPVHRALWALSHKDLRQVPRIKVCFDMLVAHLGQPGGLRE